MLFLKSDFDLFSRFLKVTLGIDVVCMDNRRTGEKARFVHKEVVVLIYDRGEIAYEVVSREHDLIKSIEVTWNQYLESRNDRAEESGNGGD